jgi:hypothetical protein
MKRISFNPCFVNKAGDDLIPGKIHTIRQNYDWWKKHEGKDVELFTWEGKPYRSKQRVFCVKRIVSVQKVYVYCAHFYKSIKDYKNNNELSMLTLYRNDGFERWGEFSDWFVGCSGKMAVLHFTDFRY